MQRYRLSKYNPVLRDKNDCYIKDDWTSFSDIGKIYNGEKFTTTQYINTEKKYINVIADILQQNSIKTMTVSMLEKRFSIDELKKILGKAELTISYQDIAFINKIKIGMHLNIEDVKTAIRLILRDCFWCELLSDSRQIKVEFGYDLYVYIEGIHVAPDIISCYQTQGIFIELQSF